jgi:hypothetical protein
MDQNQLRSTKRALLNIRRELTIDPDFSAGLSLDELNMNTALLLTSKPGKAAYSIR